MNSKGIMEPLVFSQKEEINRAGAARYMYAFSGNVLDKTQEMKTQNGSFVMLDNFKDRNRSPEVTTKTAARRVKVSYETGNNVSLLNANDNQLQGRPQLKVIPQDDHRVLLQKPNPIYSDQPINPHPFHFVTSSDGCADAVCTKGQSVPAHFGGLSADGK